MYALCWSWYSPLPQATSEASATAPQEMLLPMNSINGAEEGFID
jgi:hypothetical protein